MSKRLTDEDLLERAGIDGHVAFAVAVFLGGAGLVALLDRIGAPERFVEALGPTIALVGLSLIGIMLRSMRVSRFYAGGRAAPAAYAGLAMAALAAGLLLPFLPPADGAISLQGLLIGSVCGLALAALVTGPLLRKTGAFSIPDLIAGRFPNIALRLGVIAVVAAAGGLVALAGYSVAVQSLASGLGASRSLAVWLIGATIVFVAAPGGLAGVVWVATGAAGILAAGLGLPLVLLWLRGSALPLPVIGELAQWDAALSRMAQWQETAGDAMSGTTVTMIIAMVLGFGSLAPLLAPAIATSDRKRAQRAGFAALISGLLIAAVVAATMAVAALAFERGLSGARPADLSAAIMTASREGQVRICDANPITPAAAQAACAGRAGFQGVLRAGDVWASGAFLVRALPDMRGFGRAFSGLATAGLMAVMLALAAAGFHVFATALGHDAFYRVRDSSAMTSRRLAVTRVLLVTGVLAAGFALLYGAPDPRTLIGLAIALCASSIAPLLVLSFWPRAESSDATIALLAGLATAETVIFIGGAPTIDVFAHASVIAACVSLIAGVITSLFRRADPTGRGGAFVHGVVHGESEVLNPDKGA